MRLINTIITSASLFLVSSVSAQLQYSEVVNADSVTADALYSNSKIFITDAFKSGKDVTQLSDDASKTIIGKGWMQVEVTRNLGIVFPGKVWFKISIASKDSRYKYSFTDFVLTYDAGRGRPDIEHDLNPADPPRELSKKQWANVKRQVDEKVKAMIVDLKSKMATKNDW